jgi:hypothetical protein
MAAILTSVRRALRAAPPGGLEVLLIAAVYLAGELTRGLASGGAEAAERHARTIVHLERSLRVFAEPSIQGATGHVPALSGLLGYAYLSLHMVVTGSVLVWVYRRHRDAYSAFRSSLVLANAIAVAVYWLFPTAPPRLAGVGIGDTVSGATSVDLSSHTVASFYNPYAAVPSMHIGFSLLAGLTIARLATRRWIRIAGLAYPVFVLFVIVATGNHFLFDAAAGAAVALVAARIAGTRLALQRRKRFVYALGAC